MSDALKVGLATGLIAAFAEIFIAVINNRSVMSKIEKQSEISDLRLEARVEKIQAVTDTKLEELTREVRKHNNFAERIPTLETQMENLNHRVDLIETR